MGFDSRSPSCPRGGGGDSSCELPVRSRGEGHGSDPCPLCHLRREGCGQSEQPRERKEAELCHPGLHCLSGVPGCTPRERAGDLAEGQRCFRGAGRSEEGLEQKGSQWCLFRVCPRITRAWRVCIWLTLHPS